MNTYRDKRDRMHEQSASGMYCPSCFDMVQKRTSRHGGEVVLSAHPTEEGTWLIDADGIAYKSNSPMPRYTMHRCEEE